MYVCIYIYIMYIYTDVDIDLSISMRRNKFLGFGASSAPGPFITQFHEADRFHQLAFNLAVFRLTA